MKLEVICAWCGVKISEKDSDYLDESLPRITHSICSECYDKVLDDLKQPDDPKRINKLQPAIERRL